MKILTRLNHLKQLLETSPLDTVLDEMYHLVNSEQVLFMEFDRFVRADSVNPLLYDCLEGNAYGWRSVTHLLSEIEDAEATWFQLEDGRLKNLTEDIDVYNLFNQLVDALKGYLEIEFDEGTYDVAGLLRGLLDYYDEQGLEAEMDILDEFIEDLNDVSFKGFLPIFNQFQELVVPVQTDLSITSSPKLKTCLTKATELMESLKDCYNYLEA